MIIQAGAFLEKKNFTLGNIHPNNIALSEDNRVRIISKFSSLQQID